jgi:hypothetical protein
MISLAPIKYSEVLSQHGGPIARVEYAPTVIQGMDCTQAVAYLSGDLVSASVRPRTSTVQPDGAGSHRSPQVACHMAVSEALERWAIFHCRAHRDEIDCALDLDGSSNGFAAFPGLFKRQARKAAFRESIERHCLISWWEGLLAHRPLADPQPFVRAIEIENPFSNHSVVVIWTEREGRHAYAFGAGESLNHAIWRAFVELDRCQMLLDQLASAQAAQPYLRLSDIFERRLDFFASEYGFGLFLERFEKKVETSVDPIELLFDAPVPGPWDRYASVWRTVIKAPSMAYLGRDPDYFFW